MMIDAEMYGMIPKRKHRETGQGSPGHQVGHAQDAALLALEQLLQLRRVDTRALEYAHRSGTPPVQAAGNIRRRRRSPNLPVFADLRRTLVATRNYFPWVVVNRQATLPPAASMAALAPAVAPMPIQLDGFGQRAGLDHLHDLGQLHQRVPLA
jgi:hypothetical protein